MSSPRVLCEVTFLLCLAYYCLPSATALPLEDWAGKVEKASSHNHWEHIVKRSVYRSQYEDSTDETAHIVNVQEYYRTVFSEGWDSYVDNERELFNLLNKLESIVDQGYHGSHGQVSSQGIDDAIEFGLHMKPIPGRYIVMFQSGAGDYTLDKTIAVMQRANLASNMKIRATDMTPLRFVGKGFTATFNKKAVELVSR